MLRRRTPSYPFRKPRDPSAEILPPSVTRKQEGERAGRLGRLFSFRGHIPKMEPRISEASSQKQRTPFYSRRLARESLASNLQPLVSRQYQYSNRKTYEKLELNVNYTKQTIGYISNRKEIALCPR